MATTKEPGGTQALDRALSLLDCFCDEDGELRVSELCSRTGLNQSTVSRMMAALERSGFVAQDARTGLYRLGHSAIRLGTVALNGSRLYRASRQIAQELAHRTGLGVNVAELRGLELTYVANFEGEHSPKSFSMAGLSAPLHATAMGKALLATLSKSTLADVVAAGMPPFTPHTITGADALRTAIADIAAKGFATETEELTFGRACVAAAIRDTAGTAIGAMSISGSLSRVGDEEHRRELALRVVEACDAVSVALGYSPSARTLPGTEQAS